MTLPQLFTVFSGTQIMIPHTIVGRNSQIYGTKITSMKILMSFITNITGMDNKSSRIGFHVLFQVIDPITV